MIAEEFLVATVHVILVKVADLIIGNKMAGFLISSWHRTKWKLVLFLVPSIIKMLR